MMNNMASSYLKLLIATILFFLLFVFLEKNNVEYSYKLDQSIGLNQQSTQILQQFVGDKAVKFEVYSDKKSLIAKKIKKFFAAYSRINPQLHINFVSPIANPDKARKNAITMQGEISLSYVDEDQLAHINITELSESAIINALLRLQNTKDEWILFAEGYGMRTLADDSGRGLSHLLVALKKRGMHIARISLHKSIVLPENVKLIVLAEPKELLDQDMVNWLSEQANNGIALWWLSDVNNRSQKYLELFFDVIIGDKQLLADDQYSATLSTFPQHKITENFNQPLFIAESSEVIANNSDGFIHAQNNSQIATSLLVHGSRVVVSGDADFISNQYLNAAANKSLAVRIIDWLLVHDDRVNVPVFINKNTQLFLSNTQLLILSVVFLILIPLLFIVFAWKNWRNSRHVR
jgi:hypothetical protein